MIFPNCRWAIRIVTGLIFTGYLCYLIYEWGFDTEKGLGLGSRRSEATPINSLLGFLIIGLPCLWFTVLGRFTLRAETSVDFEDSDIDLEVDDDDEVEAEPVRPVDPPHADGLGIS